MLIYSQHIKKSFDFLLYLVVTLIAVLFFGTNDTLKLSDDSKTKSKDLVLP